MTGSIAGATVLVTGGAGFIGSHLVDELLAAGASRVRVLDDLTRGRRENLESALASGRVELQVDDIRDADIVDDMTVGCSLVYHQAAMPIIHCVDDPQRAVGVMVNGLQNVLEAARRHGVKKMLVASSASVYGEPTYLPADEEHPFNDCTLYGACKIAGERLLRAYADMYDLCYVALRPFNVYGPRMDTRGAYTEVLPRWFRCLSENQPPVIFGDGEQTMDLIYVSDVVRAYLLATTSDVGGVVLNAGTGASVSLLALAGETAKVAGRPDLTPVFGAPRPRKLNSVSRRRAATGLAARTIGFRAKIGLAEGLDRLYDWYRRMAANE